MSAHFPLTKLGSLIELANGKTSPNRSENGGWPVFGSNGVIGAADEANSDAETIVIGRVGSYCGSVYYSPTRCWVTDNAIRGTAKGQNSAIFLYYLLKQLNLNNWRSGSGQPLLNQSTLNAIEVRVPTPDIQREVGSFLAALDDRIDLLRETNATLEAIAQALFKSWFVDFDPVHANAGTQAPSLPPEIQALFPATFADSSQGPIPEGWEYVSLKEAVDIFDSKRIPLAGQERAKRKGPYPYYGAAALMDWVDDYIFDGVYLLLGEDGSVADSDGYPITQYVWGKIWVNNHAHVLQGRNGISTEHLMLYLKGVNITPYMTGAVQAKLSQSNMWRIEFLMPTKNISRVFAEFIAPMFEKIRDNSEQADSLAKLRDTLLPRLISGQLRLPEAAQAIAAITD